MNGPIRRLEREQITSRSDARLATAWVERATPAAPPVAGTWLTTPPSQPRPTTGPVLAMFAANDDNHRGLVHALANGGARVYALVGREWGLVASDHALTTAPRALLRRVPEVPATAVLSASEAWLWLGATALRLDATQAAALRHVFLRLFWHEATEEAWTGTGALAWRSARERPFDVPEVPLSAVIRLEDPSAQLPAVVRGARVHLTRGAPPTTPPSRLWFPAGPDHHEPLARLAQAGTRIGWQDRGLPDLSVADTSGEALLAGTRGRLRVRLTAGQAQEVSTLLDADAPWRFETDVPIGAPAYRAARFWLRGEPQPSALQPEQTLPLPEVAASELRDVPTTAPASLPAPQPLALAVRYRWTVVPPRVPAGATEDPLVARWRALDEAWEARLTKLRETLTTSATHRGELGRGFSRLVQALLGFERQHTTIRDRAVVLGRERPSRAGPLGAPALLDSLRDLEAEAAKHQGELEDAERKAREDEAREQQRASWSERVATATGKLPGRRDALTRAEQQHADAEEALRAIAAELGAAEPARRKDLEADQRRRTDEVKRFVAEAKRLRDEIATLQTQVAEPFEFRPPVPPTGRGGAGSGRFVPTPAGPRATADVPEDALPEVGALRTHKALRFLVLQDWADLAAGEDSARRLNAKLVAPEDA